MSAATTTPVVWADLSPRERDALVAEKVMGARWFRWLRTDGIPPEYHGRFLSLSGPGGVAGEDFEGVDDPSFPLSREAHFTVPHFTTNIWEAWQVVEKMGEDMAFQFYRPWNADGWTAELFGVGWDEPEYGAAPTLPEAICIAALRSVGVEVST